MGVLSGEMGAAGSVEMGAAGAGILICDDCCSLYLQYVTSFYRFAREGDLIHLTNTLRRDGRTWGWEDMGMGGHEGGRIWG